MANLQNDHNVYILGAGFSAGAGLPLIKNFTDKMRDCHHWLLAQPARTRELKAIESVMDFRLRAQSATYHVDLDLENIEHLFSLASAVEGNEFSENMALAIAATLDYARSTARKLECELRVEGGFQIASTWRPESTGKLTAAGPGGVVELQAYRSSAYDGYIGVMSGAFSRPSPDRRNTVITFNYDTLVEDSAAALGVPVSYGPLLGRPFSDEALLILKLHGSVNWTKSRDGAVFVQADSYETLRRGDNVPILAPPTWQKGSASQLSVVWNAAVKALSEATRIIVLGYSLPETDQHFKYLLAAGLQSNISLRTVLFVNIAASQLTSRVEATVRKESLDRGLVKLENSDVNAFFMTPSNHTTINRPLESPFFQILPAGFL